MKAGIGDRVARGLSAPEALSDGYERMLAVAQLLQVGVGAVALVAIWLLPGEIGRRDQGTVTVLLLGVYLPWCLLSRHTATLSEGPVARVLNLAFDLLAVASFALVIPSTRAAVMFAYVLVIAFHSYVSGRAAGLAMCAAALTLVLAAEALAPAQERTDHFTLLMYAVVMVALAVMLDALAGERRKAARHLGRLYRAIEAVAGDPSLAGTTDAVADAARRAINAAAVAVLLPTGAPGGRLRIGGHSGLCDSELALLTVTANDPRTSPSAIAMATGRALSIPDIRADERFADLAEPFARSGIKSMLSIPLGPPSDPIGVLNAYCSEVSGVDEDDLHLLSAYARQASAAVERAVAFEHERSAAEQLALADQLKSDFLSTVSHELRTPLTSICGFLGTVLAQWDRLGDDSKRELLERTSWNAAELRRLIESILAFSALEAGETDIDLRPYEVGRGVEDLVRHMSPALRGCTVDVDIADDLVVLASADAMQHVVGNLLTNAAKFSPAGSTIRVVGDDEDGVARLSITDHGSGIAAEEQERIFDRFYRGASTRSTRGTGIGLAIVRSTVEALGGSVSVRSAPGEGSTFEVVLPLAKERAEPSLVL